MSTTQPTTTALAKRPLTPQAIVPQNVAELMALGDMFWKGGLCPKSVTRGEGAAAIIAFGLEIGIMPAAALSSIHLTGGKGTIWGQMPMALVRKSNLLESHKEWIEGDGEERCAVFQCKRVGEEQREYRYSVSMARKAGAFNKGKTPMPWDWDTDNMLKFKARNRLLFDVFGDVLSGLVDRDEVEPATEVTATADITQTHATTTPQTPTVTTTVQVDGIPMIDDYLLDKIRASMPLWFKAKNIDPDTDENAIAKWRSMLSTMYGVESATKLTQAQAENLLGALQECDTDPLMAVLSGKNAESQTTPPDASGQAETVMQPTTATTAA